MRRKLFFVSILTFFLQLSSFTQQGQIIQLMVFRDGDVRDVAMAIARATGLNLIIDNSVTGTVSLHLRGVSPEEALSLIAQAVGARLMKTEKGLLWTKQPPSPILQVEVKGGKVTLNAQNADASEVLRQIAEKGKVNLLLPADLPVSRITINLQDVPVDEAINVVVKGAGWEVQKDGNIMRVQRSTTTAPLPPTTTPAPPPPQPAQRPTFPSPSLPERQQQREEKPTELVTKPAETKMAGKTVERKDKVTLTAVNAPLSQVLEEIARQTGIDLLVVGSADEKVTVRLSDVSVEEALRMVLMGTKYIVIPMLGREGEHQEEKHQSGNPNQRRFLIGEWGDPTKWTSPTLSALLETRRFDLKFLKAEQIPQILSPAIPTGIVKVLSDQNAVLVTGPKEFLDRVEKEIEKADRPARQVVIEAQVLEVSERGMRQLAIGLSGQRGMLKGEWGTSNFPGLLLVLQEGAGLPSQFLAQIQALIEKGEAKTLARPKVSAVSGKKASIEVVQELYFRTAPFFGPTPTQPTPIVPFFQLQAITAGVKLEIMPVIGAEGDILLEITPEVSSVVGITTEGLPQLATRKATATIWVREGQTVVLGGLRQREESKVTTKFPLISSLPLLGEIFKSHRKEVRESELIILLTPKLLEPRGM
jgi:Type II secretory pathway, component PulD